MNRIFQFGERVEGFNVPVLNEREIRASAGIIFIVLFYAIMLVYFEQNFLLLKYFVLCFFIDFGIRVFINPKFSPLLIIGRLIVINQVPEYVGAAQKKFAWQIGLSLAAVMFIHLILLNYFSYITGIICLICELFLLFESSFGICLGCIFYDWYFRDKPKYCPGLSCTLKKKHDIQKITNGQIILFISFGLFILFSILLFNNNFAKQPSDLFSVIKTLF